MSLCSPTRYAHTSAMHTITTSLVMRSMSRIWVSSILNPEDFMALKAVSTSQRFLYVRIAPSGRLKQMSICNSGTPSDFFNPAACKIDVFSLMEERFVVELFLSDLQVIEEPPGADSLTGGRLDDPEVLSDPDIITYSMFIEPSNHSFPMNSRSATRQIMRPAPNRAMNRSKIFLRSSQLDLPRFGRRLKT